MIGAAADELLLSRIEDAGLNASAPPQQLWVDGWLVRLSPGKAKRARCINAVATGRSSVGARLARCDAMFNAAGLPLLVRITPFSLPEKLDDQLAGSGMRRIDDTRVMTLPVLSDAMPVPVAAGLRIHAVGHAAFAKHIGRLRGSTLAQCQAHVERLERSPVPFSGFVMKDEAGGIVACGQFATEAELVGLYDVFTAPQCRGQGLAASLCRQLLARAHAAGARCAYLQVEGSNETARRIYRRLGFADAYAYHYRTSAAVVD